MRTTYIFRILQWCLLLTVISASCSGNVGLSTQQTQATKTLQVTLMPTATSDNATPTISNDNLTPLIPPETYSPEVKPEGIIAYFSRQNVQSIHTLNLETNQVSEIFSDVEHPPISMKWAPNRTLVAFGSHNRISETVVVLFLRVYDVQQNMIVYSTLKDDLCEDNISGYDWSPDSQKITFSCRGNIWIHDLIENKTIQITNSVENDFYPAWSPDGKTLLFERRVENKEDLYIISIESGIITRLTEIEGKNFLEGVWSPDGAFIAFYGDDNTLFLVDFSNMEVTKLVQMKTPTSDISWSPDSSKIVFRSRLNLDFELFLVDISTGTNVQLTDNDVHEYYPDWSPDGNYILFISNNDFDSPDLNIFISDENGVNRKQITFEESGVTQPSWLP